MANRKLASILVKDGWTCVKGAGTLYPLWKPDTHLNYMLSSGCSDLIVASNNSQDLFKLDTRCHINLIAALGWSGVKEIRGLFEAGYSKIFLGGSERELPTREEAEIFSEMVHVYGASSFGYSMHFAKDIPVLDENFLSQFNELFLINETLQLSIDEEGSARVAALFDEQMIGHSHELNLCAPSVNHRAWSAVSRFPVNYVNYCEHAISRLR